jgi:uncharacterized membrane protein
MARGRRATSRRSWPRGLAKAPPDTDLAETLTRNIEAVSRRRSAVAAGAGTGERLAIAVGRRLGKMTFVYANFAFYAVYGIASQGWLPGVAGFDHDLYLLGSIASVEALFLSILILITQNNASAADDRRDDLSLHISLITEHELTQLIKLNVAIARKLGIDDGDHPGIADTVQDVVPEDVLDEIEEEARETPRA